MTNGQPGFRLCSQEPLRPFAPELWGIRFADAVSVFGGHGAVTIHDPHPEEGRFVTIGVDAFARVLVVVYTWRGEVIRLISARKATRAERGQYARGEP